MIHKSSILVATVVILLLICAGITSFYLMMGFFIAKVIYGVLLSAPLIYLFSVNRKQIGSFKKQVVVISIIFVLQMITIAMTLVINVGSLFIGVYSLILAAPLIYILIANIINAARCESKKTYLNKLTIVNILLASITGIAIFYFYIEANLMSSAVLNNLFDGSLVAITLIFATIIVYYLLKDNKDRLKFALILSSQILLISYYASVATSYYVVKLNNEQIVSATNKQYFLKNCKRMTKIVDQIYEKHAETKDVLKRKNGESIEYINLPLKYRNLSLNGEIIFMEELKKDKKVSSIIFITGTDILHEYFIGYLYRSNGEPPGKDDNFNVYYGFDERLSDKWFMKSSL